MEKIKKEGENEAEVGKLWKFLLAEISIQLFFFSQVDGKSLESFLFFCWIRIKSQQREM